jgi:putative SOS response-associated peptidase YedK
MTNPLLLPGCGRIGTQPGRPGRDLAIITESNEPSRSIHGCTPVILSGEACEVWLDHAVEDADKLKAFLKPYPAEEMVVSPVSRAVNSPKNDTPDLTVPISA